MPQKQYFVDRIIYLHINKSNSLKLFFVRKSIKNQEAIADMFCEMSLSYDIINHYKT